MNELTQELALANSKIKIDNVIKGTEKNDTLVGTELNDRIHGRLSR